MYHYHQSNVHMRYEQYKYDYMNLLRFFIKGGYYGANNIDNVDIVPLHKITTEQKNLLLTLVSDNNIMKSIKNSDIWSPDYINKLIDYSNNNFDIDTNNDSINYRVNYYFAILVGEKLCGYCGLIPMIDPYAGGDLQLEIMLDENSRKKGIATCALAKLLGWFDNKFRQNANLWSVPEANNEPANKLSLRVGGILQFKTEINGKMHNCYLCTNKEHTYCHRTIDRSTIGALTFPYKNIYYTNNQIKYMFNVLKKYTYQNRILNQEYTLRYIDIPKQRMLFDNKYFLLTSDPKDYFNFNILSDIFQEECRMKCTVKGSIPPFDYFNKNKVSISERCLKKYGMITPFYLREAIYELSRECTSHRPSNIMALIQMFKAKSVLDISSGWGDRLLGAMAMKCRYVGTDPNHCLHTGYKSMIDRFADDKNKYTVIENEFETANLPNEQFDLVFTSPPYFDLEVYTSSSDKTQSSKYKQEQLWFDNFLKPSLIKAYAHLKYGGTFAININNMNKFSTYVTQMIKLIDGFESSSYLGLISYANEKLVNPQPIWIWRKYDGLITSTTETEITTET